MSVVSHCRCCDAKFPDRLLSVRDAAEMLGVSVSALNHYRNEGLIPFVRLKDRVIRFSLRDLMQYLEDRRVIEVTL